METNVLTAIFSFGALIVAIFGVVVAIVNLAVRK